MTISAVILAAGKSTRMGRQKLLMPWGNHTVLGKVIQTLQDAGVEDMILVTNSNLAPQVESYGRRMALNDEGEMLESVQIGLQAQKPSAEAALICLGDQPQIRESDIRRVCEGFRQSQARLVVPSYQMRRGHPWLIARELWGEILNLRAPQSMRDFLNAHPGEIFYVECDSPSTLQDLDTPEDYLKYKP
ncbi:MAG: nucleotidyltransferase family protein [Chloroflexi bacterium]|nr:nucleotidyltransferase family protein [Chloroflexota bacterium]